MSELTADDAYIIDVDTRDKDIVARVAPRIKHNILELGEREGDVTFEDTGEVIFWKILDECSTEFK